MKINMNDNEYLAKTIVEQLISGSPVVLASIVNVKGSSPRHGGTKMVVGTDGRIYGTIGGGKMEAETTKESKVTFARQRSMFMNFDMLGENALGSDPLCGGKATLLLDFISPGQENIEFFRRFHDDIMKGADFYFLTSLRDNGSDVDVIGHSLLSRSGEVFSTFAWPAQDIEEVKAEMHNVSSTRVLPLNGFSTVVDPIRRVKTMYCFGAGHCALPTSHIAALTGFRVVVIDDRSEFANAERFPDASDILVVKDFKRALEGLSIDKDSFIIIVTRGHQHDRVVLEQALKTDAYYIGMMGSKRKRDSIYSALVSQGVSPEQLNRVHCPIGVSISAETPEEIAVSIVGEMVMERAKQLR